MPNPSTLVLADGLAANRTFTRSSTRPNGAVRYVNIAGSTSFNGREYIDVKFKEPAQSGQAVVAEAIYVKPTVNTIAGVEVISHTSRAVCTFYISPKESESGRKDLAAITDSLMSNLDQRKVVEKLESWI